MMTAPALLQQLHDMGVILVPHPDGTLHCRAPQGILTPDVLAAMRQHKAELHGLVEALEERVAIAEYCGGLARAAAEAVAWRSVLGELPSAEEVARFEAIAQRICWERKTPWFEGGRPVLPPMPGEQAP
jgi:hypothetical protein